MTLNGVMAVICVISANSVASGVHCVKVVEGVVVKKVHVRYLVSCGVSCIIPVIRSEVND